jgi:glycosyltransferase involved in cell wall biosynthesis
MAPSISLLIPAYNERATIADVMTRSLAVLRECAPNHELIVLDDASTDGTFAIMQDVQRAHPEIRIERHAANQGIAATFEDLYRLASKDFVFLTSGDGQFPPEVLSRCVPLLDRADIVICRRVQKRYTWYRHVTSFAFRWLPRLLFGVDVYDPGSVKCVRRDINQAVPVRSKSVFVEAERMIRAVKRGYRLATVDIVQEPRKAGVAKGARIGIVVHAVADLLACWWEIVIRRRP